jgi:hypothetical protein
MVEGLALTKPRLSIATIHRKVRSIAEARGWRPPSYASIYAIVNALDPAAVLLAHEGEAAFGIGMNWCICIERSGRTRPGKQTIRSSTS